MGLLDSLGRDHRPAQSGAAAGRAAPGLLDDGSASLRRRRDELVAEVAELHWDLGGLAYEMAIRDHFRLDVLVRKASELQHRDAELGELERVLSLQDNAGAGMCGNCGAVRSRGAVYCWQCGHALMEQQPSATAIGEASTVVEKPTAGEDREGSALVAGHGEPAALAPAGGQPAALAADEATSVSR
ncbi:MAG TPA: hypothetical protein VMU32_07085 [Solirubrobacteraceae bacterium]|nr:hypothetical protein [Solirubrobacteraceae bacterium]